MRLKEKLATPGRLVTVFAHGPFLTSGWVEMVGNCGLYDAVWFDQEHTGMSLTTIENAARAARLAGLDSFVRLTATDYATVMRPLEAGAGGIMAAQVRRATEVERIVRWVKFHPRGERGMGGLNVDARYGTLPAREYYARANAETFVAIQIEHAEAVADIDAIAAVPDVDLLFIGPADLAQSLGVPGEFAHPRVRDAITTVATAAARHQRSWAILPAGPEMAEWCVEQGCKCLSLGFDAWIIQAGLMAYRDRFASCFAKRERSMSLLHF